MIYKIIVFQNVLHMYIIFKCLFNNESIIMNLCLRTSLFISLLIYELHFNLLDFISFPFGRFRFILVSFRFDFVSVGFVSFRYISFCLVGFDSFLFCFALYKCLVWVALWFSHTNQCKTVLIVRKIVSWIMTISG